MRNFGHRTNKLKTVSFSLQTTTEVIDRIRKIMFLGNCPPTHPLSQYFALSEE